MKTTFFDSYYIQQLAPQPHCRRFARSGITKIL